MDRLTASLPRVERRGERRRGNSLPLFLLLLFSFFSGPWMEARILFDFLLKIREREEKKEHGIVSRVSEQPRDGGR